MTSSPLGQERVVTLLDTERVHITRHLIIDPRIPTDCEATATKIPSLGAKSMPTIHMHIPNSVTLMLHVPPPHTSRSNLYPAHIHTHTLISRSLRWTLALGNQQLWLWMATCLCLGGRRSSNNRYNYSPHQQNKNRCIPEMLDKRTLFSYAFLAY